MSSFKIIGLLKIFKCFTIHGHGGHLGHVTLTIYINFCSLFLNMLHMKFGFIEEGVSILSKKPGAGANNPLGPKFFQKHKSFVHLLIPYLNALAT